MVKKALEKPARFANWRLQNGRLFKFVEATYPGLQDPQDLWREVVPKERRKELIREYHEPPTMGHMGVTKTYARLMERFFLAQDEVRCGSLHQTLYRLCCA
ncbi:hypothetical protein NQ318_010505 [Aromia moschata]|uniref:Integrase zinc-binding domain-containing protein n=1 Tax=Aromia moschata TaxID=1265417 RepID=A0AAV8YEP4_9CUCU|nr:hypothetical protein NQ318_010505 [Aromia moschata]